MNKKSVAAVMVFLAIASHHGAQGQQAKQKRKAVPAAPLRPAAKMPANLGFYVGTYTDGKSEGIYYSELLIKSGKLAPVRLAAQVKNPSFLAIHPTGKWLYAVSEIEEFNKQPTGAVAAFSINGDHTLTLLNQQPSAGTGPCHLVVDATGGTVLVANYGSGSVASLPIEKDGSLGAPVSKIQHVGSSVNPGRQMEPHAHSINLDPQNQIAFAADLGTDEVFLYRFDAEAHSLTPAKMKSAKVAPGSGPRHFTFHPSGKYCYVINEMGNTITSFAFDAKNESLKEIDVDSTLAEMRHKPGDTYTAEVVMHPTGKFLFGSNRGDDSIAAFSIDESTGKITLVMTAPTNGKTPRNFVVDPTGTFLLAENQDSDDVFVLKIDPKTGALEHTSEKLEVPKPVCIRFMPLMPPAK